MSLFKPAAITAAKLKMAFMGFQGSGKTYTATDTAIGLVLMLRKLDLADGAKPIAFADTEKGSDWILPRVQKATIDMVTVKTRAFSDLVPLVTEAEGTASVLLIDSLTHFWAELCETYAKRKAEQYHIETYRLQFQDWAYLKSQWRTFTDAFVNSNLHIIVCGRAGYEYDMAKDEDTGKKQLEKTGIKFKAEGEMGYEPDLLVLMDRVMDVATKKDQHVAHVIKDRSTLLDGKEFVDPSFKDFKPHIDRLNLHGKQLGVDTSRTSAASIPADAPRDRSAIQRGIIVDEINDLLLQHGAAGTSAEEKKRRSALMRKHFGTASKTAIEESMSLFDLKAGYVTLYQELEGKVCDKFLPKAAVKDVAEINDRLPDHSAPAVVSNGAGEPSWIEEFVGNAR